MKRCILLIIVTSLLYQSENTTLKQNHIREKLVYNHKTNSQFILRYYNECTDSLRIECFEIADNDTVMLRNLNEHSIGDSIYPYWSIRDVRLSNGHRDETGCYKIFEFGIDAIEDGEFYYYHKYYDNNRGYRLKNTFFDYKVKKGDTIEKISLNYYVKVQDLLNINNKIKNKNHIEEGQIIKIPTLIGTGRYINGERWDGTFVDNQFVYNHGGFDQQPRILKISNMKNGILDGKQFTFFSNEHLRSIDDYIHLNPTTRLYFSFNRSPVIPYNYIFSIEEYSNGIKSGPSIYFSPEGKIDSTIQSY